MRSGSSPPRPPRARLSPPLHRTGSPAPRLAHRPPPALSAVRSRRRCRRSRGCPGCRQAPRAFSPCARSPWRGPRPPRATPSPRRSSPPTARSRAASRRLRDPRPPASTHARSPPARTSAGPRAGSRRDRKGSAHRRRRRASSRPRASTDPPACTGRSAGSGTAPCAARGPPGGRVRAVAPSPWPRTGRSRRGPRADRSGTRPAHPNTRPSAA